MRSNLRGKPEPHSLLTNRGTSHSRRPRQRLARNETRFKGGRPQRGGRAGEMVHQKRQEEEVQDELETHDEAEERQMQRQLFQSSAGMMKGDAQNTPGTHQEL